MAISPRIVPSADVLQRVRAEYLEMSALRLTSAQAQRLFGLDPLMCSAVLQALLDEHFLMCTSTGLFVQAPMGQSFAPYGEMNVRPQART